MAAETPHKVFTVTLEFELGPRKTSKSRLKSAYAAAVACATQAVQDELLGDDHLTHVHAAMTYSYLFDEHSDEIESMEDGTLVVETPEVSPLPAEING